MSTRNIVKNIRSAEVIQGKPKLPTSDQLDFGEIAINYAEDHETLSFKNNLNEIVSLSVKTVDDVTVNGSSVVSNKTANITMKGSTTPVADTYSTTTFPSPFESKAEHISATDKVDVALKKVESNISELVNEVVDNENVVSEAISKLANSAGTIDGSKNITYIKATNAHYINNATSVHDATVKLDSNVFSIRNNVDTLGDAVGTLTSDVTSIGGKVTNLENNVTTITSDVNTLKRAVDDIGNNVDTLKGNVNTIKGGVDTLRGDVNTLKTQVTNLKSFCDTNFHQAFGQIGDLQDQINSLQGMVFVDLGLPSGTMWAKCNIGATSESDYGDYFMWGSTTPNTNTICDWSTAPFNNGTNDYDSNYFNSVKNTVCPNGILAKGYDVAYKTTNGAARMPTDAEFTELISNTRMEWTQVSDVNGWKFTSKTDTSNYIFIPAAGYRINGSVDNIGKQCIIWSSSLNTSSYSFAYYLGLYSDSYIVGNEGSRCGGNSVRAVRNLPL